MLQELLQNPLAATILGNLNRLIVAQTELLELQVKIAKKVSSMHVPEPNETVFSDYSQVRPREVPKPVQQSDYDPRRYNRAYTQQSPAPYQIVHEHELEGYGDPGLEYRA